MIHIPGFFSLTTEAIYGTVGRLLGSDLDLVAAFLFSDGIIDKADQILAIRRPFLDGPLVAFGLQSV